MVVIGGANLQMVELSRKVTEIFLLQHFNEVISQVPGVGGMQIEAERKTKRKREEGGRVMNYFKYHS